MTRVTSRACDRSMPPARQGISVPSSLANSTLGSTRHSPIRRSLPNHDTISETDPTLGNSRPNTSSEARKSVPPIGVLTLKLRASPGSTSVVTGVVAREYSPVPGISATA